MKKHLVLIALLLSAGTAAAQYLPTDRNYAHLAERTLRYRPDGEDFVIVDGDRRFTRALYGTNTAFRVETGDVPEFALFMPRMGGNLQFALRRGTEVKPLDDAGRIEARYTPGRRGYTIDDPLLGGGTIRMSVLAMGDADGFVLRAEFEGVPADVRLEWTFGGASDARLNRNGDMNADPEEVFWLLPEYCTTNRYTLGGNRFDLDYGDAQQLTGSFPGPPALSDARRLYPDSAWREGVDPIVYPVVTGRIPAAGTVYLAIYDPTTRAALAQGDLPAAFEAAEAFRRSVAGRVRVDTPDPFINTLGGVAATAGDAIWEYPVYHHGAIGWRTRLPGWRGAYAGDFLGWHDRARIHFDAYGAVQFRNPADKPVIMDTALHLARSAKVMGTPMYSSGYIAPTPADPATVDDDYGVVTGSMSHYDMNNVYIDALLWHLNWTGDLDYARRIWPVIERHLAWEKRNFDPEDDGLYDAYATIWASDALQYNGGAVTHSSAYVYRANRMAAMIAAKIGVDPEPYRREAERILTAVNNTLWMSDLGWWAEYKEKGGAGRLHPHAAVWTFYHAVDSELSPDGLQAWQAGRYINTSTPHFPVRATDYDDGESYVVTTTDWMPYHWSINNVAFAESGHTALALWQAGHPEEAFDLFRGTVLDAMYMGGSPGNVAQVSYYDAARGETYRDFADPTGVFARLLVQGLFGIYPDLLNDRVEIRPGLPAEWDYASFETPDVAFDFRREGLVETYAVEQRFPKQGQIILKVPACYDSVNSLTVNGRPADYRAVESVGRPMLEIACGDAERIELRIEWGGTPIASAIPAVRIARGQPVQIDIPAAAEYLRVVDPQGVWGSTASSGDHVSRIYGEIKGTPGHRAMFVRLRQGLFEWLEPVEIEVLPETPDKPWAFTPPSSGAAFEPIDMSAVWNDRVTQIFKNRYMSPRLDQTTLQIPWQGIGEWCVPLMDADIDDRGLRGQTRGGVFTTSLGIPFTSEADTARANIAFTSLWDNYPRQIEVPLSGRARHAYLLMAGSTNHMQAHMVNGVVIVHYKDGTAETLELIPPETWAPIEQDFFLDGVSYRSRGERPYRVQLSTGLTTNDMEGALHLRGNSNESRRIPGGAATILDLPIDPAKELDRLTLRTESLEVVIGLMGVTLVR